VGRLKPGITARQAEADLQVIAARLEREYPRENKDTGALVIPLGQEVSQRSRLLLLALSAAAGCVLLIACANLANLLLARASAGAANWRSGRRLARDANGSFGS
jgi:putative ABC transport system permease protein